MQVELNSWNVNHVQLCLRLVALPELPLSRVERLVRSWRPSIMKGPEVPVVPSPVHADDQPRHLSPHPSHFKAHLVAELLDLQEFAPLAAWHWGDVIRRSWPEFAAA